MKVGILKEIKNEENRVCMTPAGVEVLVQNGHRLLVQKSAGCGSGFNDEAYTQAGAEIAATAEDVFARSDMVMHVKEPQPSEYALIRKGQIVFTYLHLAADERLTRALMETGAVCIAYETIQKPDGSLPLLTPMSEVAGRMAIQAGAHCLEMYQGGRGTLLGGVPGVAAARVVILGGGVVGTNAARMAMGLEAHVTVIDKNLHRLFELDMQFGPTLNTIFSTVDAIEEHVQGADLVVGAVLLPGAAAPKLVSADMVKGMKRGSVIVDVAIDQGGCVATAHPTTHADPTYIVDEVVHYCVANMPGAVARTSTFALNNATLPFTLALADEGYRQAMHDDPHLLNGLNVHKGKLTYEAVARDLGEPYQPAEEAIGL
jgi:alanine dehydrogenase